MTSLLLLAGEDTNKAGPIGLLVLVILGIACYWLFRSMSKHLRRVPNTFTDPALDPAQTAVQPARQPQLSDADGATAAPGAPASDTAEPPAP